MFKFTIVIAALAVSAALAINVPEQQYHQQLYRIPQQQQRQQMQQQQQQQGQRDQMVAAASGKQKPDKVVYVTEVKENGGLGELIESAAYKLFKLPKKVVSALVALIVGKLKALNAKGLLKAALLAGLVAVLGAVAAIITISVAGLVSAVTGVCAVVLNFKNYLMGGGGGDMEGGRKAEESQIDYVTDFVLGAFEKYGEKQ